MTMTGIRRTIRFFCDLGHRFPLWESGTEEYARMPEDYDLSDELSMALGEVSARYAEFWDEIYDCENRGIDWSVTENGRLWWADGDRALAALRAEVEAFADVVDER